MMSLQFFRAAVPRHGRIVIALAPLMALWLAACGGSEADTAAEGSDVAGPRDAQVLAAAAVPNVCFYENAKYGGKSFCTNVSATAMPAGFDNIVSSVTVPSGVRVELYDGTAYAGKVATLTASSSSLSGVKFDNLTSSFKITSTVVPTGTQLWSDPATWGGTKPVAGAAVVIPAGSTIVLDESTPALGTLTVDGSLVFKDAVTAELKAAAILVRATGALRAGSAAAPFTGRATITLTDTNTAADPSGRSMGTRGILVYGGGKLELFGKAPPVTWTKLAAHSDVGATTLQLAATTGWQAGDQIVVAPTEWYPLQPWATQAEHDAAAPTERRTVASASGAAVTLSAGLSAFKWGRLQYATDTGLSLTPGTFTPPHPDAASVLDERAEVGHLTRNIVIQGIADTLWTSQGYGAHVMVMDLASSLQLDGVELRQVGQAGKLGRYPIHWHLLSYASNGSTLGDAVGHFVRNSAIWNSRQRCVVIHGTNGVEVRNNVCYDIKGHGIFLEDGAERRNIIEGNLVLRTRSPIDTLLIAQHEQRLLGGGCGGAASGLWLTNPDNTVRNNAVADSQGYGFWLSYPKTPVGLSASVPLRPINLAHAPFEFNSARANGFNGVDLECALQDTAGNTAILQYAPTTNGLAYDYTNGSRFTLRGLTLAKNLQGGYLNRATLPDYRQFVLSGNRQRAVTGAVDAGTFKHALVVANSLNDRQPYPADASPQLGIASYHSLMDIAENTFIGFANRGSVITTNGWEKPSGTFGTDDYYFRAVEKGFWRNTANKLIASDPGYRALPPHLQPTYTVASNNNWTLAGAIWDPQGIVGTAGRYWVLDSPFLRDASCQSVLTRVPAGNPNGLNCAGPYYGVGDFWLNRGLTGATQQYLPMEKIEVRRLDAAGAELGRWVVEQGYTSNFLGNMRHFAGLRGSSYELRFPQFPYASATKFAPSWVQLTLSNLLQAGDSLMLGVHYTGKAAPRRVFVSTSPDNAAFSGTSQNSRLMTATTSRAAVAAGDGSLYWQDTAQELVWIKLVPLGLTAPWAGVVPGSDLDLYRDFALRIEP